MQLARGSPNILSFFMLWLSFLATKPPAMVKSQFYSHYVQIAATMLPYIPTIHQPTKRHSKAESSRAISLLALIWALPLKKRRTPDVYPSSLMSLPANFSATQKLFKPPRFQHNRNNKLNSSYLFTWSTNKVVWVTAVYVKLLSTVYISFSTNQKFRKDVNFNVSSAKCVLRISTLIFRPFDLATVPILNFQAGTIHHLRFVS